ncbi:MAG: hypothetical protein GWO11_05955 [Desulfuromonadales bacterium]|nr:hypothetical protein [Desulfuromonadales bacterium]NIR33919.1 hypothetical protein [Desulfuromonadales bacterium]NIS43917.1 hypothetical protein [Desulfuromonadales bacterium]
MNWLRLFLLLLACAMLVACGRLELTPAGKAPAKSPGSQSAEAPVRAEMRRHFAAADYVRVLQLLETQLRNGASETDFAREYPRAINGVLQQAREHWTQGRPALAGKKYRQALEFYPADPLLRDQLDMGGSQIDRAVSDCSEVLMEQGLIAYRAGRLGEAIAVWQTILSFSPSHQPAIKAIRTARIQLQNLQAIDSSQDD